MEQLSLLAPLPHIALPRSPTTLPHCSPQGAQGQGRNEDIDDDDHNDNDDDDDDDDHHHCHDVDIVD